MPWETAVDRKAAERMSEAVGTETGEAGEHTNVAVIILQQRDHCSQIGGPCRRRGLSSRFIFGFGKAGEPGPPEEANFGNDVVLPLIKDLFRLILRHLGPHAPPEPKVFRWEIENEDVKRAVHSWSDRRLCNDITRVRADINDTFGSALNKCGYWMSSVSFVATCSRPKRANQPETCAERDFCQIGHGIFRYTFFIWSFKSCG